ncbi:MAG: hypothetical protein ACXVDZ_08010, partial [Bacteroidia bacterium]
YTTSGTYATTATSTGSYRSMENNGESKPIVHHECHDGTRDPFIIEYGITNRIGIGLTSGNDIFNVNSSKFYGFTTSDNNLVKTKTSEFTFDSNYHFFVTKRLDLSVCGSFGLFGVDFHGKQNSDGNVYNYSANGGIVRGGLRVHYYFYKSLGAFGMVSTYAGSCSPNDASKTTVATNTSTKIKGQAIEAGLCYRFF